MSKYFITVTYRNLFPPKQAGYGWECPIGEQTCNGFINQQPITWLAKVTEKASKNWDAEKEHTSFGNILFYAPIDDNINTNDLQDLS
jgi:hypothetical protein